MNKPESMANIMPSTGLLASTASSCQSSSEIWRGGLFISSLSYLLELFVLLIGSLQPNKGHNKPSKCGSFSSGRAPFPPLGVTIVPKLQMRQELFRLGVFKAVEQKALIVGRYYLLRLREGLTGGRKWGEVHRTCPLSGPFSFRTYFHSMATAARDHQKVSPQQPFSGIFLVQVSHLPSPWGRFREKIHSPCSLGSRPMRESSTSAWGTWMQPTQ